MSSVVGPQIVIITAKVVAFIVSSIKRIIYLKRDSNLVIEEGMKKAKLKN